MSEAILKNNELISLIIPVYNVEKYIGRCLDSVIAQTYSDLDVILIDDGTKDSSGDICEEYAKIDTRFRVFHKENGGLSDARNFGIQRAIGEYIVCIDSDDYVDEDYIEYLYNLIKKYNTKISICQHRTKYENGSVKDGGKNYDEELVATDCLKRMLYHDVIDTSAWAKMYHKDLFNNVQYPKGKLFEDIGTTYALMLQCDKIAVGYESKYNYIFHSNSIVNGTFTPRKFDMLEMTDRMADDVTKLHPELSKAVERRQLYARFSTLNQMLYTDEYQNEKDEIIRYIKEHGPEVMKDKRTPKRDRVAYYLLKCNYCLYRMCWVAYQNRIMGK